MRTSLLFLPALVLAACSQAPVSQPLVAGFNTETPVVTQSPSEPWDVASPRAPLQTLNSLPPGAANPP